jgi:hypothetical protein
MYEDKHTEHFLHMCSNSRNEQQTMYVCTWMYVPDPVGNLSLTTRLCKNSGSKNKKIERKKSFQREKACCQS